MNRPRPGTYFFVILAGAISGEYLLFVNGGFGVLMSFLLLQLIK